MKTYAIDTGDSNVGPVGFVAHIDAEDEQHALDRLGDLIDPEGYTVAKEDGFTLRVYINPDNVKIEEVEEDEE